MVKHNKSLSVGDWALCDGGEGSTVLVQVARMVQVSLRDDSCRGLADALDGDDDDETYAPDSLRSSIRMQAFHYLPGLQAMPSRGNSLCIKRVRSKPRCKPTLQAHVTSSRYKL